MCSLNMTFKASVSICVRPQRQSRWRIGPTVRKTPLERRLAEGQMSPQHLLQAGAAARPWSCIPSVSWTCCHRLQRRWWKQKRIWEVSAEEDNEGIITVSGLQGRSLHCCPAVIRYLTNTWYLHSFWFVPFSLFTFPSCFTCCCPDCASHQVCRFLLLEQLLRSVCSEHSIKESLSVFCLTPHFFSAQTVLSCICHAPANLKSKLLPVFAWRVQHLCWCVFE